MTQRCCQQQRGAGWRMMRKGYTAAAATAKVLLSFRAFLLACLPQKRVAGLCTCMYQGGGRHNCSENIKSVIDAEAWLSCLLDIRCWRRNSSAVRLLRLLLPPSGAIAGRCRAASSRAQHPLSEAAAATSLLQHRGQLRRHALRKRFHDAAGRRGQRAHHALPQKRRRAGALGVALQRRLVRRGRDGRGPPGPAASCVV